MHEGRPIRFSHLMAAILYSGCDIKTISQWLISQWLIQEEYSDSHQCSNFDG
jgi:hypothetical protein